MLDRGARGGNEAQRRDKRRERTHATAEMTMSRKPREQSEEIHDHRLKMRTSSGGESVKVRRRVARG